MNERTPAPTEKLRPQPAEPPAPASRGAGSGSTERTDARPIAEKWLKIHLPTYSGEDLESLTGLLDVYAKEAR